MKKIILFTLLFLASTSRSQIVNAYANASEINAAKTTLTLTNVNQANHTFSVGEEVVVMQMQDDAIGTNTTNVATFGNIGSIGNAGVYETAIISSLSPATGTPTTIVLSNPLVNNFNIGTNSSVQLITLRNLGASYTTTANISGLTWDNTEGVGGVIAISVTNTLTLNHSINADGLGFRGGSKSNNTGGNVCAAANSLLYVSNSSNVGSKGEGIYRRTAANYSNGRGRILNGGGGGGFHNAGGGGGGNYTSGGQGGNGYNNGSTPCNANPAGGLGGLSLSSYISANRIFMGGGGGGGQQNNSGSSNGGNGGGIILLKAGTILTNSNCASAIKITANGITASNTSGGGNDGAGGGGGGGSIVLQVDNYSNTSTCPLTINSNGGNGGNVINGQPHAGGGGGGQGIILFSGSQPTVNVSSVTSFGVPGIDNTGGTASGTGGGGPTNGGIFVSSGIALPIELIYFNGFSQDSYNLISWESVMETNFKYYELESSEDGINFVKIATINPKGNLTSYTNYTYLDFNFYKPITYYRLKMVDLDNSFKYSPITAVEYGLYQEDLFSVFPNPVVNELFVSLIAPKHQTAELEIMDVLGRAIYHHPINLEQGFADYEISTTNFENGFYFVHVFYEDKTSESIKIIISR